MQYLAFLIVAFCVAPISFLLILALLLVWGLKSFICWLFKKEIV